MKMNLGKLKDRMARNQKMKRRMSPLEKAFYNEKAIKHFEKAKDKVGSDYFFGA